MDGCSILADAPEGDGVLESFVALGWKMNRSQEKGVSNLSCNVNILNFLKENFCLSLSAPLVGENSLLTWYYTSIKKKLMLQCVTTCTYHFNLS